MSNIPAAADTVLDYWFGEIAPEHWFADDAAVDAEIARRFGELNTELACGVPAAWQAAPQPLLAAVIVLDQFSRNLYRGDTRAYAQDEGALALARHAVDAGFDGELTVVERQFLYMPFMHAEDRQAQRQSIELFTALGDADSLAFARRHRDVIERFGRFPARNAALGRASTAAERDFLANYPDGF